MVEPPRHAAGRFVPAESIVDIAPYGSGNVNETFLVRTGDGKKNILQKINPHVFADPHRIMHNLRRVVDHMLERCSAAGENGRRWRVVRILPTVDGEDFFIDRHGAFWRALAFIDKTLTYDTVADIGRAREAGFALGRFHRLVSDLDVSRLYDTLADLHITPRYIKQFEQTRPRLPASDTPETRYCRRFVADRKQWAGVLEQARNRGELPLRPIHGDPKISNILFDAETGRAITIIDLDTVKPGLVLYDIGDCLRSCCNRTGETATDLDHVVFDTDLCRALLASYLDEAQPLFTDNDFRYLYDAVRLIAFELGLRFFTDYLVGNIYFRVNGPKHNLHRALVQFRLTESIERQEKPIRAILADLQRPSRTCRGPKGRPSPAP